MQKSLSMCFLGTGNAQAHELGSSCCVLEQAHQPWLLIDCGLDSMKRYQNAYKQLFPPAIFITHAHLDHIGGLEGLFYLAQLHPDYRDKIKLFVPVRVIEIIHKRIAEFPGMLAEGGVNFWDCFQLIPVSDHFWYKDMYFSVFPVRHHAFQTAFGLALHGAFLYTGDTCPIPEVINTYACRGEIIFHDCGLQNNPSHTGVEQIKRYYNPEQIERMVFYHYESEQAALQLEQMGFHAARPGQTFLLRNAALSSYHQPQENGPLLPPAQPQRETGT